MHRISYTTAIYPIVTTMAEAELRPGVPINYNKYQC